MPLQEILQTQLHNTRLLTELMKESGQNTGRITTLEHRVDRIEDRELSRRPLASWTPRDWMMAASGIAILLATVSEKIGWTTAVGTLLKLYGGK